ncbi:hypothetical protein PFISCL1PPCAC_9626 [Pristionchus fissidentatus]|uniref:Large ribosomal subunit protein bL32m n=1 Tax=Pristionchus fissidentatus TaxID=1538716 RepID=A0AAV5VIQ9_9BILA|nr:hypothetical protein PFISCL1PPCAC_9626 [Pristionchus fissidentatus]
MLRRAVARLNAALDDVIRQSLGGAGSPPFAPALALAPSSVAPSSAGPSLGSWGVADIMEQMKTLWGVPKYRTSHPKKQTRKFAYTRLLTPFEDITTCETCGEKHEMNTICGNCYEKVRLLTNMIKQKMLAYNPYKGERPPKEVEVRFTDDEIRAEQEKVEEERKGEIKNGVRVVEMERARPSWFKQLENRP